MTTRCLGVRGAIDVKENTREAILSATRDLIAEIVQKNQIQNEDIGSIFFTTTTDLNAEYPALAVRQLLGWHDIAMLCGHEMLVPGSLPRIIRVLLMWNTTLAPSEIQHVYLGEAQKLRPDRSAAAHPPALS
jgi:chorismate mutase